MIQKLSAFHSIVHLCHLLDVSVTGYRAWGSRTPSARNIANAALQQRLIELHQASRGTYGLRRLQSNLRDEGYYCSKTRISKLMKTAHLKAACTKRYKVTTNSKHTHPIAPNLLKRRFNPNITNMAWATDITYITTQQGWLYLATVLDLCSRKIVGWSLDKTMKAQLPIDAIRMAITQRKPKQSLIVHSDQGRQYASSAYQKVLTDHKLQCSMSTKGCCYDNAVMESFYHTLKTELMQGKSFETRQKASNAIFDYIEVFYNRQRKHSTLGYMSPAQFEEIHKLGGQ